MPKNPDTTCDMRLVILLLPLLLSSACKKSPPELEDLLADHKTAIEAKLARIEKLAKRPLPTIDKEGLRVAGPVKLTNFLGSSLKPPSGNAVPLHSDTLSDLTKESAVGVKFAEAGLINSCAAILRKGTLSDGTTKATGYLAERPLKLCAALRYVFVIDELSVTRPVTDEESKSFSPGTYEGAVYGYDLEVNEYIGGVRVAANTLEQATNYRGKGYASDAVNGMFLGAVGGAIETALAKAIPGLDLNR